MARGNKGKGKSGKKVQVQAEPKRCWLADCTKTLIQTIADPLESPAGACACMGVCLPSQKLKAVLRGTFTVGTNQTGFALLAPAAFMLNDTASLWTTDVAYTGSTFTTAATGVNATINSLAPYSAAQLAGTATTGSVRLVAGGIRVRCIDTIATAKGRMIAYTHPNHLSLAGLNFAGMSNRPGISIASNAALEEAETRWVHVDMDEYDYGTYNTLPVMGIMVSGAVGDTSFEWEAAVHYEVVGPLVSQLVSPSVMDPIGGPAVSDMVMAHPEILQSPSIPAGPLMVATQNRIAQTTSLPVPALAAAKSGSDALATVPPSTSLVEHLGAFAKYLSPYDTNDRYGHSGELKRGAGSAVGFRRADAADQHAQQRDWIYRAALRHGPQLLRVLTGLF